MFDADNDLLESLWVEKYRPKNLDDVVLPEDQKEFLQRCLQKNEIPHLLFVGPPGSGKSTTARIIVDSLIKNEMDVMILNGSDSTGVDVMRTDIQSFLKCPPFESKLKLVYIDEFDYTTSNSQAALRNIMEKYADNGRFICTGNYASKIIDAIHSRFQIFEMKTIEKEFAIEYCQSILKKENVEFDGETVKMIVQNYMPDVRKALNTIQQNVVDGKLKKIDVNTIITHEKKVCGLIVHICDEIGSQTRDKTLNFNAPELMTLLSKGELDFRGMYQTLFQLDGLPLWAKIKVNQFMNTHQSCAIPNSHFMAMIFEIITAGLSYHAMFSKK